MRIYVPATFSTLQELAENKSMPVRSGVAFAVTPALREYFTSGDDEELGYQAYLDAGRASLRLLSVGDEDRFPHRRVILTFEVDESTVTPDPTAGESTVRLDPPTLFADDLASIHIDVKQAEEDTAQALRVIDEADLGDDDAEHLLANCEDHDLAWYDPQELPMVVQLL